MLHVHILLKAFGSWLVEEGIASDNPMKKVPRPIMRDESIKPFADEDLLRLFAAADRTKNPTRDKALTSFLSDTGVRASELCALTLGDVDLRARTAQIRCGKGGKSRMVVFGKQTAGALWRMLRIEPGDFDAPLFIGERGGPLTPNGLSQLMRRLGKEEVTGAALAEQVVTTSGYPLARK